MLLRYRTLSRPSLPLLESLAVSEEASHMANICHLRVRWLQVTSAAGLLLALTIAGCTGAPASHIVSGLSCAAIQWPTPLPTPTTAAPPGHPSYQLDELGPISLQNRRAQITWHLGDTMQFDWCPRVNTGTGSAQSRAEVLTATLQGPFPSFAAANAARPTPGGVPPNPLKPVPSVYGPVVASAAPIHTTTWAGVAEVSRIPLSLKLVPGYYLFVLNTTITQSDNQPAENGGDSGIVKITG
jgi:hypothetical protein